MSSQTLHIRKPYATSSLNLYSKVALYTSGAHSPMILGRHHLCCRSGCQKKAEGANGSPNFARRYIMGDREGYSTHFSMCAGGTGITPCYQVRPFLLSQCSQQLSQILQPSFVQMCDALGRPPCRACQQQAYFLLLNTSTSLIADCIQKSAAFVLTTKQC